MAIEVRPATRFGDVRTVVGPQRPDATVCWCLSYRIPSKQNRALRGPERGDLVRALVREDPPPGWGGAVDLARSYGAPAVEGYPVENQGSKVDPPWPMWARAASSSGHGSPRPRTPIRCLTGSRGC